MFENVFFRKSGPSLNNFIFDLDLGFLPKIKINKIIFWPRFQFLEKSYILPTFGF